MEERLERATRFEELVEDIFRATDPRLTRPSTPEQGHTFYDFRTTIVKDHEFVVKTKFYRSSIAQIELLKLAAGAFRREMDKNHETNGILAVSCIVPAPLKEGIFSTYGVVVFDAIVLLNIAKPHPMKFSELAALLNVDAESHLTAPTALHEIPLDAPSPVLLQEEPWITLKNRLVALPTGQATATAFELLGEEICKFLFDEELVGWKRQTQTDDGLNRFDLVCRIASSKQLWHFLSSRMNSQYILFEFKNYSTQIGQPEILTTEKYLLEYALRRVAFVVTRRGWNASAEKACRGALREHGKLILMLSDVDIERMLLQKGTGTDPTDFLMDRLDDLFLSLSR